MLFPNLPLFATSSSSAVPTAPHPRFCWPREAEPPGVYIRQNLNLPAVLLSPQAGARVRGSEQHVSDQARHPDPVAGVRALPAPPQPERGAHRPGRLLHRPGQGKDERFLARAHLRGTETAPCAALISLSDDFLWDPMEVSLAARSVQPWRRYRRCPLWGKLPAPVPVKGFPSHFTLITKNKLSKLPSGQSTQIPAEGSTGSELRRAFRLHHRVILESARKGRSQLGTWQGTCQRQLGAW